MNFVVWMFLLTFPVFHADAEDDPCAGRSCRPTTGDLLVGRKARLSVTSTCGLRNGRERFCEENGTHNSNRTRARCFYCDSRTPWTPNNRMSHRIENVVTESDAHEGHAKSWWQSANGVQNVSIRLDLEAEFLFDHLNMTFRSRRPAAMLIERSSDFGRTWKVYRYFAHDCASSFPGIPLTPLKKVGDVVCTQDYSGPVPSTAVEVRFQVDSPPKNDSFADEVSDLYKITNLRINMSKLHTLGDDRLDESPETDEKYYYAIYKLSVHGSCGKP